MNNSKEIWKNIPSYEGLYQVSNLGRVKRIGKIVSYNDGRLFNYKNKILKPCISKNGYFVVTLTHNKKVKTFNVHKLVAMTFLDHKPRKFQKVVDHVDNNKLNNKLYNLELVTHRFNSTKDMKNKSSKYIGVTWDKNNNYWQSRIKINKKNKHLGSFKNEYEAHLAYQKALKELQ